MVTTDGKYWFWMMIVNAFRAAKGWKCFKQINDCYVWMKGYYLLITTAGVSACDAYASNGLAQLVQAHWGAKNINGLTICGRFSKEQTPRMDGLLFKTIDIEGMIWRYPQNSVDVNKLMLSSTEWDWYIAFSAFRTVDNSVSKSWCMLMMRFSQELNCNCEEWSG